MLKHVKTMGGGDILLESLQVFIFKFGDTAASGTDHMVVVLAKVPMFIAGLPVVKGALLGKPEAAHHMKGLADEIERQVEVLLQKHLMKLLGGQVLFRLEKHLQNFQTLFKLVDIRVFEERFEMLFFSMMQRFHNNLSAGGSGDVIRGAGATGTGPGLNAGAGGAAPAPGHGVAGGTHDPLEIVLPAVGAFHFNRIVFAHHQQLEKLLAFKTPELIQRHTVSPWIAFVLSRLKGAIIYPMGSDGKAEG
jgi:hypothetical protein